MQMHQWKKNAGSGILVLRLNDDASLRSGSNLAAHFVKSKMFLCDDDEVFLRRDQLLGAVQRVLQHRPFANEVEVLLGQIVGASVVNQISQSGAVPA